MCLITQINRKQKQYIQATDIMKLLFRIKKKKKVNIDIGKYENVQNLLDL